MTSLNTAMKLGLSASLTLVVIGFGGCTTDTNIPVFDSGPAGSVDAPSGSDGLVAANCDGIVGEGFEVGQIAANWTSLDGNGNPVSLYDYCGKVILYENGAEW